MTAIQKHAYRPLVDLGQAGYRARQGCPLRLHYPARGWMPLRLSPSVSAAPEYSGEQQAQLLSSMRTPRERIASKSRSRSQSGSMSASNLAAWSTLSMATRVPSLIWIR